MSKCTGCGLDIKYLKDLEKCPMRYPHYCAWVLREIFEEEEAADEWSIDRLL